MTRSTAKRLRPNPASGSRPQPRDLDVLASLAWAGILTTTQIQSLHHPSRRVAQRRLRALFDRGFVRAHLQHEALHRDNLWLPTARGITELVLGGRLDEGTARLPRLPPGQKLAHVLGVRDLWVHLVHAERAGVFVLDDVLFEGDLAKRPDLAAAGIVPDALAVFEDALPSGSREVFLEYDRGTETTRALREKFARWAAYLGHARPSAGLVVVVERPGRVSTITTTFTSVGIMELVNVIPLADFATYVRGRFGGTAGTAQRFASVLRII